METPNSLCSPQPPIKLPKSLRTALWLFLEYSNFLFSNQIFLVSLLSKSKISRSIFCRTTVMHFVWAGIRRCSQMLTYTLNSFHGE